MCLNVEKLYRDHERYSRFRRSYFSDPEELDREILDRIKIGNKSIIPKFDFNDPNSNKEFLTRKHDFLRTEENPIYLEVSRIAF